MKMIIFLALAGLSLAAGKTDPGSRWGCLYNDLKTAPKVLQELVTFICTCRGKFDSNVENCEIAFYEMKFKLRYLGCQDDDAFGTAASSIEENADEAINVAEQAERAFLEITEGLGLNDTSTELLCKLLNGDLLSSKCLGEAIKKNLPGVITASDEIFCKTYKDADLARKVIEFSIKIGCVTGDAAGSKEAVENLVNNLGDSLKDLLKPIIDTLKGLPLITGITCNMRDLLRGQGGIK